MNSASSPFYVTFTYHKIFSLPLTLPQILSQFLVLVTFEIHSIIDPYVSRVKTYLLTSKITFKEIYVYLYIVDLDAIYKRTVYLTNEFYSHKLWKSSPY